MRVTAFMLFQQFTRNLNKNMTRLNKAQEQLSTGRRLTKTSDDVIATRGIMSYKVSINAIEQYTTNSNEGISQLGFTENLLSSTQHLLDSARELSVNASSDHLMGSDRMLISSNVQNLYNGLLDIANSKLKNKYLFSGFTTGTQSFSSSGVYQGDSNDIEIYISEGIKTKVNTTGTDAFSDDTKFITADLTGETLSGVMKITTGTNNAVVVPGSAFAFAGATPEEIRDTINAPMTDFYATDAAAIGTGKLTFKIGNTAEQTIEVNAGNGNTTLSTLVSYINTNVTGIEAEIAYETTEAAGSRARILFRPTTAGETFTIDVSEDGDSNDFDSSGLSALLHTDDQSNMTKNALGIEAFVMNGAQGKRLLFSPTTPNTDFTIEIDEDNNGTFNEADDIDTDPNTRDGLALLFQGSSASTNLTNSVTFFTIIDNLRYATANNDLAGIRGSIHLLDGALESLINVRADVGSKLKYLEDQQLMLEDNKLSYQKSRSVLEDADITQVALDVSKIQTALEALRISSMKSLSQSLMQFLN